MVARLNIIFAYGTKNDDDLLAAALLAAALRSIREIGGAAENFFRAHHPLVRSNREVSN
jgi:hypothetical protein